VNQQSEEFKKEAVQKLLDRGNRRVQDIAEDVGVTAVTLYKWSNKYAIKPLMKNSEKRPQDWSAQEKFKAVMEFDHLPENKQGEFLRTHGLHTDHIESWKEAMKSGLGLESSTSQRNRADQALDKQKIKDLERELRRKEKALAETAALLILKKKANLIWGTGEDE
jgi:transposase